ncbi:hypothetical protein GCM10009585_08670 [Brevibacterium paucivorans]
MVGLVLLVPPPQLVALAVVVVWVGGLAYWTPEVVPRWVPVALPV